MSEQAKPTPGPWYLSFDGGQRDAHVWANANMMACVASVHPGVGEETDEFAHNARLIAAAPQLLAACEAVEWSGEVRFVPIGFDAETGERASATCIQCGHPYYSPAGEGRHYDYCQLSAAIRAAKPVVST